LSLTPSSAVVVCIPAAKTGGGGRPDSQSVFTKYCKNRGALSRQARNRLVRLARRPNAAAVTGQYLFSRFLNVRTSGRRFVPKKTVTPCEPPVTARMFYRAPLARQGAKAVLHHSAGNREGPVFTLINRQANAKNPCPCHVTNIAANLIIRSF